MDKQHHPTAQDLARTIALETAKARAAELLDHVPIAAIPEVLRFIESQIEVSAAAAA
jgi:hypothetical protein